MSALRLAVLLVLGASCCVEARLTENPDTPEYARLASIVVEQLKEHMEARLAPLKAAIEDVQATVEEACGGAFAVDIPAVPPPPLPSSGIAEITSKLQAIEGELGEMKQKIDALDGKTENLATTSSVTELRDTIGAQLTTTMRYVESKADEMLTRGDVEEVVKEQVEGVKEAVKEVQETCGNDEKMDQLVENVWEVKERVEEVKVEAQATKTKVEQCVEKDFTEEVRGVGEKVDEVAWKVEGLQGVLEVELQGIAEKVEEINNTTQLLVNATLQDEGAGGETEEVAEDEGDVGSGETAIVFPSTVYPCLDSTFPGTRRTSLCQTAVRYKRCHLPHVSYHCCHTCTSLGLLPEMGPWRYQNMPRGVTPIDTPRLLGWAAWRNTVLGKM